MHQISANQFRYDCTGTTSGQVGLVFGYKSGADYWLWARDMNGTAKIYHVQNGVSTQVASTTYPAPVAGTATSAFFIGGWSFSEYAPGSPQKCAMRNVTAETTIRCGATVSFRRPVVALRPYRLAALLAGRGRRRSSTVKFPDAHSGFARAARCRRRHLTRRASQASRLNDKERSRENGYRLILVENLRLKKFQTTFALTRATGQSQSLLGLIFNAADRGNYNYVSITHTGTVINPIGYVVAPNSAPATASGGSNPSNIPTCAATDTLWCRAQNDGTTLTLKCINSATAPSEATWSSTTACYSNASLANIGGQIGFNCNQGIGYISQFTLKSWNTTTSAFDITEHWDNFTVDSSGYANETPTYDAAGNLTYDGQQFYTWDAWNRLMTIAHAYRDSGGTLQHGQVFAAMVYDGRNRRIQKTVSNTGQWDCNYHYFYTSDWQLIETRNGSSQTLKQHVWGIRYIDELVQIAANSNPSTGNTCSGWFYATQDANFNVLGLVNPSGALVERYEYTPYGQIKVLFAAGNTWAGGTSANDPGCYAIAYASLRYTSNAPYYGLSEIGHQGMVHDEESALISNRDRVSSCSLRRFSGRDQLLHVDGSNVYLYERGNPVTSLDPDGNKCVIAVYCGDVADHLAVHCGLYMVTDTSTHSIDGSGGGHNTIKWKKGITNWGSFGAWTSYPDSVCNCLNTESKRWNALKVPRTHTYHNSNWTMNCLTTKCGIAISAFPGLTEPPIGWSDDECCAESTDAEDPQDCRCIKWENCPCP